MAKKATEPEVLCGERYIEVVQAVLASATAGSTLSVRAYSFDGPSCIEAIELSLKNGARVRIVPDHSQCARTKQQWQALKRLESQAAAVRLAHGTSIRSAYAEDSRDVRVGSGVKLTLPAGSNAAQLGSRPSRPYGPMPRIAPHAGNTSSTTAKVCCGQLRRAGRPPSGLRLPVSKGDVRDGFLPEFMFGEHWSTKTLNWRRRQTGPARPKTASQSSTTLNCLLFSLAGHFGMSLSIASRKEAPAASEVRRTLTSQTPCQSSGRYCVVPLNLFLRRLGCSGPFGRRSASAAFCRPPEWSLSRTLLVPCPSHGMCHSDFGTGSHVHVAFVRLQVLKRTVRRCLLGS